MPEIEIAAKEFAETGSGCMATPPPDSDELFLKVAAIAGWKDIWQSTGSETYFGNRLRTNPSMEQLFSIPRYDRSIDAIWGLFEELGLYPLLERLPLQDLQSSEPEYSCSHYLISKSDYVLESRGLTPAIALCKLLIAISEKIE